MKFIALFFHIILDMKREVQAEIITENSFWLHRRTNLFCGDRIAQDEMQQVL
jgi:hypothetical protein